jgi:hypothetical protein
MRLGVELGYVETIEKQEAEIARLRAELALEKKANDEAIAALDKVRADLAPERKIARLREALEIIAGQRQCLDNLMSNQDVARAALAPESPSVCRRVSKDRPREGKAGA